MKKMFISPVLKSGMIIFAALSLVASGSYAAWTSQVKVIGNIFETGTIEIGVTPAQSVFSLNNMAPGVWSEKELTIQNSGSLAYNYLMSMEIVNPDENSAKLFNALWVETYNEEDELIDDDWAPSFNSMERYLASGESEKIKIKIKLDDDADDSYQNLSVSFNLIFDATQALGEEVIDQGIVINEIAWMGTKASSSDEWIELYNPGDEEISLEGWILKTADEGMNLPLASVIPAKGYYLIERSDDSAITDIAADLVGSFGGGLSDNGEQLILINDDGDIIDTANGSGAWLAGKKTESDKISMERKSASSDGTLPESWGDNDGITKNGLDNADPANEIYGTPKAKNSVSE